MKKNAQARLKQVLEYDPESGIFRWRVSRGRVKPGLVAGCKDPDGYVVIRIYGEQYFAHRLAWLYIEGYFPENEIDHKDRDKANNRIKNLREVSRQCNARNTGNRSDNTSGVKGVFWHKRANKWQAQIKTNRKRESLGLYENFDNAVMARYRAEKELNWSGCDSSSPAYQYLKSNGLLD